MRDAKTIESRQTSIQFQIKFCISMHLVFPTNFIGRRPDDCLISHEISNCSFLSRAWCLL